MTTYLYPQNLKATANLWLWGAAGFCHPVYRNTTVGAGPGAARLFVPAAVTLCFGFLSIRMDDTTVLDFMRYAVRYFISTQQYFEWR